jgi:hypothetical protein
MNNEHHMGPTHVCPSCQKVLDCATGVTGDHRPRPDDLTVCLDCQAFLKFGHGTLSALSEDEFKALPVDVQFDLMRVKQAILAYGRTHPNLKP